MMESLWKHFDRIVVFDTETTGIIFERDRIIEIGAVALEAGTETRSFNCLVRLPGNELLPPFITELTGITDRQLQEEGVEQAKAVESFCCLLEGAGRSLLVAYNAQFDLNFLEQWGIQTTGKKQYDVMMAFAREYGEWNDFFCDYKWQKLGTAAAYYGYHFRAHDSLEDVRATLYIFEQMQHSNKRELFEDYFWEDSEDEFDEEEEW